ncbi:MAG: hypothetical protein MH137_11105 [Flavobacteriales bacterium]|nr:hypothetical protein [Flavobacteriales bacterium]
MDVKPFIGLDGHTYSKVGINLIASSIFHDKFIQDTAVLVITPYRFDEDGNVIPAHELAMREVIPDINFGTKEQQLTIANIEAALASYVLNKLKQNG